MHYAAELFFLLLSPYIRPSFPASSSYLKPCFYLHSSIIASQFLSIPSSNSNMKRVMTLVSAIFFLLMLLAATGPMGAEARTCESPSHKFQGTCVRQSNCATVCQTEGFPGGECRGLRRRCFCVKQC